MAKKQNTPEGDGVPDWLITFADLMSLLVCFFVLIISFSIQDKEKLQIVAGSLKEAFGIKKVIQKAGVVEIDGVPVRDFFKTISAKERENSTDFADIQHDQKSKQGPEANTHEYQKANIEKPQDSALAAASLKQAWQELPQITQFSSQIIFNHTEEGLSIEIVNQEQRPMFPIGSATPYPYVLEIIKAMTPQLAKMPNLIQIVGHTASTNIYNPDGSGIWELSSKRANSIRRLLENNGIEHERFHSVSGKADTKPLFFNDSTLLANGRITITLLPHAPVFPVTHKLF